MINYHLIHLVINCIMFIIKFVFKLEFLETRENISESWQAKYVNLLDAHEEIG